MDVKGASYKLEITASEQDNITDCVRSWTENGSHIEGISETVK
jgi:hypothetical protein